MRCDGKPVRPGTGTTHRMSKASEPDQQNGTLFADSIMASSLNRLHQQAGQKTAPDQCHCVNLALATREPSTEDIIRPAWLARFVPKTDPCGVDIAASFEHSVRAHEDRLGDADPEGFRGVEVHDQI